MVMIERRSDIEEKVPFGSAVQAFMSNKPEVLWGIIKETEVEFPKFAFKVGMRMMELGGPDALLKFLEKNELRDKELVRRLTNEAMSRKEKSSK
jgi:hypothetical protein